MMKLRFLLLFTFLLWQPDAGNAQSKTTEVVIKTNIYCDHCHECGSCEERIIHELKFTKGVMEAHLDIPKSEIRVVYYRKKTDVGKIKDAINKAGFDADDQPASQQFTDLLDDCCKKRG